MLDQLLQEQPAEDSSEEMWLDKVGEFLSDPNLKHLRILDSALKLEWPDFSLPINFHIKGDYDQGLARTTFDGDFAEFPFLSEIRFGMKMEIPMQASRLNFLILTKVKS